MRRACRSLTLAGAVLAAFAPSAWASEPSVTVDWNQTAPLSGRVVDGMVEVTSSEAGGTFPLVAIADPATRGNGYALTGRIRYRGVAGVGFLEMWSVFPDGPATSRARWRAMDRRRGSRAIRSGGTSSSPFT